MPKTTVDKNTIDYEDSIKNYGKSIEHIETFVEAVRRFPGKPTVLPGLVEILRKQLL